MNTTDPSVHCDCREISARRVQIGSFFCLLAAAFAYVWFAWRNEGTAATVANLCMGVAVGAGGVAGICRNARNLRSLGWVTVALGAAIVLFDLWVLFLR